MAGPTGNSTQVNLRISPDLRSRLDAKCEGLGIPRNAALILAIESWLKGPQEAPQQAYIPQQVTAVDQPARDAMTALLERVQKLEESLHTLLTQGTLAEKDPEPDFADAFKRG